MIAPATPATTTWLSVLLGAYFIAGGVGVLLHATLWPEIVAELDRSPALVAIAGAVAFSVGALIVSIHNVWTDPAAIIVTAAGWIAVVEGLTLLAFPELWLRFARAQVRAARPWGAALLLVGAFLLSSAAVRPFTPPL